MMLAALVFNASALYIEAAGMGISNNEMDQFGNWASAWARTSSGSFDFVPAVTKGLDAYGNPYVDARCQGNAWTTNGFAEVGTSSGNGYDSVSSVATVSGIGSITTLEYAVSGYGQMYTTQSTGAELGDYGSINAYSQFWGYNENANANAYVDGSGTLSGYLAAGYDNSFKGSVLEANVANNGYGTTSITAGYGDLYTGSTNVNANANNGVINTGLYAQRTFEGISTSGYINNIAGEYGRIDLNANAYSTGANSNKNVEFWNGFANSYVAARIDGGNGCPNAFTSWDAPA